MGEFIPFAAGCVLGAALTRLPRKAQPVALPILSLMTGALASAVNGELASGFWAVFISLDSTLVWLGAGVSTAAFWYWTRLRSVRLTARS